MKITFWMTNDLQLNETLVEDENPWATNYFELTKPIRELWNQYISYDNFWYSLYWYHKPSANTKTEAEMSNIQLYRPFFLLIVLSWMKNHWYNSIMDEEPRLKWWALCEIWLWLLQVDFNKYGLKHVSKSISSVGWPSAQNLNINI